MAGPSTHTSSLPLIHRGEIPKITQETQHISEENVFEIGIRKHLKTYSRKLLKSDGLAVPAIGRVEPEGTSFHVRVH